MPPKDDEEQKCWKQLKKVVTDKCKFTKEGIINIEIENASLIQVFFKNSRARKTAAVDKKN